MSNWIEMLWPKVIRNRYVFRKNNRWNQYLPRREDGNKEYDFEKNDAMPKDFNQPMDVETPPKLWLVWAHRATNEGRDWTNDRVKQVFGCFPEPGKMHVFKNTADINDRLWRIKHLIEVRPITFPNGEPTTSDVAFTEIFADGRCVVDRETVADPSTIKIYDPKKQFAAGYLSAVLARRDGLFKDVYPDNVYTPSKITLVE
ncbi:hypothetical protein M3Y97_00870600 [Aphelenchoides bicaudatus]|nr:hypothetical protein M3Y97_00870600 [Aphelenchoides bicaudatus]